MAETLVPTLERRLRAEIEGGVHFDRFTRGRYATDASHYQIMPHRRGDAAHDGGSRAGHRHLPRRRRRGDRRAAAAPRRPARPSTARSSSTAPSISPAFLNLTSPAAAARVEPGIVLDELNRALKPHGLWFPVDVSTASRATIGGMAANNSCGGRSLRYGNTRENVHRDRRAAGRRRQGALRSGGARSVRPAGEVAVAAAGAGPVRARHARGRRDRGALSQGAAPGRRLQLDALVPGRNDINLAHILVGSEGTLAFSTAIELKLSPLLGRRAVGACHFGSFHEAMAAAQHIVKLGPIAVELVDATMIGLARDIAMFRPTLEAFVRGAARGTAAGRIRRGRTGREPAAAQAAARI